MTTLVIGARGSIGREVLRLLLAAGEPVRASVRNRAFADLPAGVPVVAADLTRPETLPAALDGVKKVFLYCPPEGVEGFAKAAQDAGVDHVVLLSSGSVLLPYAAGNAIAEEHRLVEQALAGSGLRWTPIRPLVLANNALSWGHSIRADSVVRLLHPEAAMAPVHERDVAAVAVAGLDGVDDVSGVLTGPEPMTQRHQVELIAQAVGRPIHIEELSAEEGRIHFSRFMPPDAADAVVDLVTAALNGGSPATTTAQRVLGRVPLPFAQWARDHAADFR
ncbi:NAD(P)H-binding protein [Actinoallomurus vinaceus]|uniref:NAD(P)H-binding protein n=1 Tax=Actinoallomurus vinaceus TaxID=1080074 RepID=A0ABP8UP48_9ACTN